MNENEISQHIVSAAIEVHRTLGGPGLLESIYEEALVYEHRNETSKSSARNGCQSFTRVSSLQRHCALTLLLVIC